MPAETTAPTAMPTSPPPTVISNVSTRNCMVTSRRRAPAVRRTPISRVRSTTEVNMMFMMPMPPISSANAATLPTTTLNVRWVR